MTERPSTKATWRKRLGWVLASASGGVVLAWIYAGSLIGVDRDTVGVYESLKAKVKERGYEPRFFVISGRRYWLDNKLLTSFGGASPNSRHLHGDAVDIIVLDVNDDGVADSKDVDVLHRILNEELIENKGGIGTYKNESGFFDRQMVHFDLRGHRARWSR